MSNHETQGPPGIDPRALYFDTDLRGIGLSRAAAARAREAGELRSMRSGSRRTYLGAWLLDWIEAIAQPTAASPREREEVQRGAS